MTSPEPSLRGWLPSQSSLDRRPTSDGRCPIRAAKGARVFLDTAQRLLNPSAPVDPVHQIDQRIHAIVGRFHSVGELPL